MKQLIEIGAVCVIVLASATHCHCIRYVGEEVLLNVAHYTRR